MIRTEISRSERLSDKVAHQLAIAIERGELKAGERLPRERQLTELFQVSRMVIREALSQLKSSGLIRTQQGLGAFVASVHDRGVFRLRVAGEAQDALRDVFELRMVVEASAAQFAAERATKSDIAAIKDALQEIERSINAGMDGVDADARFHVVIAAAARNTCLEQFIAFLGNRLHETITTARTNTALLYPDLVKTVQAEHRAIFEAITGKDGTTAGEAMRAHLQAAMQRLGLNRRRQRFE